MTESAQYWRECYELAAKRETECIREIGSLEAKVMELREKLKLKTDQVDQLIRDHKTAFEAQENVIAELRDANDCRVKSLQRCSDHIDALVKALEAAPRRTPELTERVIQALSNDHARFLRGRYRTYPEVADAVLDEIFGKDRARSHHRSSRSSQKGGGMRRSSGRVYRKILGSPRRLPDGKFIVVLECRHVLTLTRVRNPNRALCRECVLERQP